MIHLLIDSREKHPYTFTGFEDVTWTRATLETGDISLPGFQDRVAIERKNGLDELITCLTSERERFERELQRARNFEHFHVVIEGRYSDLVAGRYRSKMTAKAAVQSIAAFSIRYRIPFLFADTRAGGEMLTYSLLSKFLYEIGARYEYATRSSRRAI